MKTAFSTLLGSSLLAAGLALASSAFSSADAASITFDASQFTGDSAKVNITLDDTIAGEGKVQFRIDVVTDAKNTNTADIRGIFFNILDNSLLSGLSITGSNVTTSAFSAGKIDSVGNANLNGGGKDANLFDVGVEIGTEGIGKDDIQSTIFTLSHSSIALTLAQFSQESFGMRLTSVGTVGGAREGSSKLVGAAPVWTPPVVAEKPPVVAEKPPVVAEKPPVVEEKPPVVEEKPPVVEEKPPVVEEKPPVVEEKPPVVEEKPPVEAEKVPEPATLAGLGLVAGAFAASRRRKSNKA